VTGPKSTKDIMKSMRLHKAFEKMFYMRENLEEVRVGLHCSHIIQGEGEFCMRSAVLALLFQQCQGENFTADTLAIFAAGNSIHEKWQGFLDMLIDKEHKSDTVSSIPITQIGNEERSYDEKFELFFTPDGKIITDWDNVKYVVEWKSMNTFAYANAVNGDGHPKAFKQVQMYMHETGIRHGLIFLEDKNTQKFTIIEVVYDPSVVIPFVTRLYEIQDHKTEFLLNGYLPPKKGTCSGCNSKMAKQCNMRDACYQVGIGRVGV